MKKSTLTYQQKYLKYKEKYLKLKAHTRSLTYTGGDIRNFEYAEVETINFVNPNNNEIVNFNDCAQLSNGLIAICKSQEKCILLFDLNGNYNSKIGPNIGSETLIDPVFINQLNTNLAIIDMVDTEWIDDNTPLSEFSVKIVDQNGNFVCKFVAGHMHSYIPRFNLIELQSGNFAFVDYSQIHNLIRVVDINGNLINTIGFNDSHDNHDENRNEETKHDDKFKHHDNNLIFGYISGLIQMSDSNLAICDHTNHCVKIFNLDGTFVKKFGTYGSERGNFSKNLENIIQLKDDNLAILDSGNNCVHIFTPDGVFIESFGKSDDSDTNIDISNLSKIFQISNGKIGICQDFGSYIESKSNIKIFERTDMSNFYKPDYSIDEKDIYDNINYISERGQDRINVYYTFDDDSQIKLFDFSIRVDINDHDHDSYYPLHDIESHSVFKTLYYSRSTLLTPNSHPYFKLVNLKTNESDRGIDAGGITKTIFRLLSIELGTKYFVKDDQTHFYRLKTYLKPAQTLLSEYYFIGQLFGLAIKLKQLIDLKLDPFLLFQMTRGHFYLVDTSIIKSIIYEYDPTLFNTYPPFYCYNDAININSNYCSYDGDGFQIDKKNIPEETTNKIKEQYTENKEIVKSFVSGFRQQLCVRKIYLNKLSLNLFDKMISGISNVDYNGLIQNLNFINFDDQQKNAVLDLIREFEKCDGKYIEKLLLVITGTNKMPSIGYPNDKQLRMEIQNQCAKIPYEVHTCFNQMIFSPIVVDEYIRATTTVTTNPYSRIKSKLYEGLKPDYLDGLSTNFEIA